MANSAFAIRLFCGWFCYTSILWLISLGVGKGKPHQRNDFSLIVICKSEMLFDGILIEIVINIAQNWRFIFTYLGNAQIYIFFGEASLRFIIPGGLSNFTLEKLQIIWDIWFQQTKFFYELNLPKKCEHWPKLLRFARMCRKC